MGGMKQAMTNATRKGGEQPTVAGAPRTTAGRSAGYRAQQMPPCAYGAGCTRRGCVYRHPPRAAPPPRSDEVCRPFLAGACEFGAKCHHAHPDAPEAERLRAMYGRTACRWGDACLTRHCLYYHPSQGEYDASGGECCLPACGEADEGGGGEGVQAASAAEWLPSAGGGAAGGGSGGGGGGVQAAALPPLASAAEWLPSAGGGAAGGGSGGGGGGVQAAALPPLDSAAEWLPSAGGGAAGGGSGGGGGGVQAAALPPLASAAEWLPSAGGGAAGGGGGGGGGGVQAAALPPLASAAEWLPSAGGGAAGGGGGGGGALNASAAPWVPSGLPWGGGGGEYRPSPGSWAAVAIAPPPPHGGGAAPPREKEAESSAGAGGRYATERFVPVPTELWLVDVARIVAAAAFSIADPIERFAAVNQPYVRRALHSPLALSLKHEDCAKARRDAGAKVLDMHYQSVRTAPVVLDKFLRPALQSHLEVWIITGTGHHTDRGGHQRSAVGGVLHATVKEYVQDRGHDFFVGRDKAGHSGAFLVLS